MFGEDVRRRARLAAFYASGERRRYWAMIERVVPYPQQERFLLAPLRVYPEAETVADHVWVWCLRFTELGVGAGAILRFSATVRRYTRDDGDGSEGYSLGNIHDVEIIRE